MLPTCAQHRGQQQPLGLCQATEACGQLCLRPAIQNPPFHLCFKHKGGTNTLPCHLLRIPIELRLMIYRYLLPTKIPTQQPWMPRKEGSRTPSILRVNRQINQEASLVLYGEVPFEVRIDARQIMMCGQEQWCDQTAPRYFGNKLMETKWMNRAKRIQRLEVQIHFGELLNYPTGIGIGHRPNKIILEDYTLYQVRNIVEKFAQFILRSGAVETDTTNTNICPLLELIVQPILGEYFL